MTTAPNERNACLLCGEQVTTRARMNASTWFENADGARALREVWGIVHSECYMAASPEERMAVLERAPAPGGA